VWLPRASLQWKSLRPPFDRYASHPPHKMPFLKAGSFWKSSYQINARVKSVAASCAFWLEPSCDYNPSTESKGHSAPPCKRTWLSTKKRLRSGTFLHVKWSPPAKIYSVNIQQSCIQTRSSLHLACRLKKNASFQTKASQLDADRGIFFLILHKIFRRGKTDVKMNITFTTA